jgi:hypothetical protein
VPVYLSHLQLVDPRSRSVVKYIRTTSLPTTLLYTSHAYSDFLHLNHLERDSSSSEERYILSIPVPDDTVLPGYAVEQTGEWVLAVLQARGKWIGELHVIPSVWYRLLGDSWAFIVPR